MEVLLGKSSVNGPFSIAMLNYQRVYKETLYKNAEYPKYVGFLHHQQQVDYHLHGKISDTINQIRKYEFEVQNSHRHTCFAFSPPPIFSWQGACHIVWCPFSVAPIDP